jgi:sterol desaturase/sphingolipid hydroxylase (fatty acid hydroxylase superfamily)
MPDLAAISSVLSGLGPKLGQTLGDLFLRPGSSISLASLACAFAIATAYVALKRYRRGRSTSPRLVLRALLPRRFLASASGRADIGFFAFNTFAAGVLFGWAIVSTHAVSVFVHDGLTRLIGDSRPPPTSPWVASLEMTVVLFLAYELGYWVDHYLKHRIPALWEFHRVHHTAEHLSPLTNFRVHPVDSILFLNSLALFIGAAHGAMTWGMGAPAQAVLLSGTNVLTLAFLFLLVHLQHSHIWIATRGVLGRLIQSPAHHQLHHSTNPAHFNTNFGGSLALFDWLFGTLLIPTAVPQRLTFGVEAAGERPHSMEGVVVTPFLRLGAMGRARLRTRAPRAGRGSLWTSTAK